MNRFTLNATKDLHGTGVFFGVILVLFAASQAPTAVAEVRWGQSALRQSRGWYASAEARAAAEALLLYQSTQGAWPKNTDLFKAAPSEALARIHAGGEANTIDNGATTMPMRFLAKMIQATHEETYKEAFLRGLEYLLAAQYSNGGWPQFYPLRKGYYSHITFNDNAMVNVLEVLRDVAKDQTPYDFVDDDLRSQAAAALERGIDCILKTQVRQDGKLTAWCAQHDEKTLAPAWARAYEPPSLSGGESVGIVRFLMSIEQPSPEVIAAVEGAVAWLRSVAMKGVRLETIHGDDGRQERRLVPDPKAPLLWARFYELGTNRPLYLDRDSVFRYDFAAIGYERRSGYAYHGTWAAELLTRDYPRWRQKHALPSGRVSLCAVEWGSTTLAGRDTGATMAATLHDSGPGCNAVETEGPRHRVLVCTDIGGTDPDDFQSMVHLLVYADRFDIEGLVSSPYGSGRKAHILQVIDLYERDYNRLRTYSDLYPAPVTLRTVTKQGAFPGPGYEGFGPATEGSEWIVRCARRDDPRPLWILVWGGIEDLAQALHDAPEIEPRLRVYFIGGPNKKWSVDAYQYIMTHHPRLWIIEANATYRGWFIGGNQQGEWDNQAFVAAHVAGHGALGDFFATLLNGTIKMGDSPSVRYLLHGTPEDPSQPGWGGRFVRAWERPHVVFQRLTGPQDRIEQFGVFELALPLGDPRPQRPQARLLIENQELIGSIDANGAMRWRFSPKDAKTYRYTIHSNVPALEGKSGELTSLWPPSDAARHPSSRLPHWWTDDPSPGAAGNGHIGARTVSEWREHFLHDFATRMDRCEKKVVEQEKIQRSELLSPDRLEALP